MQFPASLRVALVRKLLSLLDCIHKCDPQSSWKVALEFRHQSWYQQDIYRMLENYQMGVVLHDKLHEGGYMLNSDRDCVYVRFHGPGGDYLGSYEDGFLYEYTSSIRNWMTEGKQVYTYFNNTIGNAIENLNTLRPYVADD
ncbi:DUF72 domain-containing protein [Pedobacter panaciterrae]|uniref:DUF72 domain-containing protein n=1 Tax=Pedobacter panaciterrae TaxID=363849 RepID=UPI00293BA3B2|nr:DUF72 domain-containing protein [Pedobacter panaciterrae]